MHDLDPGAEALAWASSELFFSSSVSGLQTADLECDLGPHSGNAVSQALARLHDWFTLRASSFVARRIVGRRTSDMNLNPVPDRTGDEVRVLVEAEVAKFTSPDFANGLKTFLLKPRSEMRT